jgi:hypothetical protein
MIKCLYNIFPDIFYIHTVLPFLLYIQKKILHISLFLYTYHMVIVFCKKCYEELKGYGMPAEVIYEHICAFYAIKRKPVHMTERELKGICCRAPIIEFLERKGFLITTEADFESLLIKPRFTSINKSGETLVICCKGEK